MENRSNDIPANVPRNSCGSDAVIVIGRQTGSGGRQVGKAVAKKLGISYYDRELLKECAERMGYAPSIFEMADERRPSMFRSLLAANIGLNDSSPMTMEQIYSVQSDVIRQIADREPAVFVGRTADYILRDKPGLFSVFLHAPEEWRARNMIRRLDSTSVSEAVSTLRKMDSRRQDYYNYFTPGGWGKADNYDVCIDSSRFDPDTLSEIIVRLATKANDNGPTPDDK